MSIDPVEKPETDKGEMIPDIVREKVSVGKKLHRWIGKHRAFECITEAPEKVREKLAMEWQILGNIMKAAYYQ